MASDTPKYTIADLVETLPGRVSERAVRRCVRELGCFSQIGNAIMLSESDMQVFYKGIRSCSNSPAVQKARTGSSVSPSPENASRKAQAAINARTPKKSYKRDKLEKAREEIENSRDDGH